jgi:CRP-like cAMP-binding protein
MGEVREYTREQPLIRAAEPGDEAFLIIKGCVKVLADTAEGRPVLLAVRMAGDMVGELAVLYGQPRTASVRAADRVVARMIKAAELLPYLSHHPAAYAALNENIAARFREAVRHRAEVNNGAQVIVRLARALCKFDDFYGVPVRDGRLISAPLGQADFASFIGATEQSVRKALAMLDRDGLVQRKYRETTITDPAGLRDLAGLPRAAA